MNQDSSYQIPPDNFGETQEEEKPPVISKGLLIFFIIVLVAGAGYFYWYLTGPGKKAKPTVVAIPAAQVATKANTQTPIVQSVNETAATTNQTNSSSVQAQKTVQPTNESTAKQIENSSNDNVNDQAAINSSEMVVYEGLLSNYGSNWWGACSTPEIRLQYPSYYKIEQIKGGRGQFNNTVISDKNDPSKTISFYYPFYRILNWSEGSEPKQVLCDFSVGLEQWIKNYKKYDSHFDIAQGSWIYNSAEANNDRSAISHGEVIGDKVSTTSNLSLASWQEKDTSGKLVYKNIAVFKKDPTKLFGYNYNVDQKEIIKILESVQLK